MLSNIHSQYPVYITIWKHEFKSITLEHQINITGMCAHYWSLKHGELCFDISPKSRTSRAITLSGLSKTVNKTRAPAGEK
jgi:hypothetical protein